MSEPRETMSAMIDRRPPPEQRRTLIDSPMRVTKREVPSQRGSKLDITAGWNGNAESYYFVVLWTEDVGENIKASDVYSEGGHPWNQITNVTTLAEQLIGELDLSSPSLPLVLYELMSDKESDYAQFHYFENEHRNRHLLALIGNMLDQRWEPVVPAPEPPRARPRQWNGQ